MFRTNTICHLLWSKPVQKFLIYDRIVSKKETFYYVFLVGRGIIMATIQWFPGHMSKARRQVQENLKFVDFVTILVDARLPLSSQNPMLTKIVGDKPKLLILNKADLADSAMTKEWRQYF